MDNNSLYQELILDHSKNPKNFGALTNANRTAESHNTLCGDEIRIEMIVKNKYITDIKFSGCGCAIVKASASMMTEELKGKTIEKALTVFNNFEILITNKKQFSEKQQHEESKLHVFTGIQRYPSRVKCATLPWHTMKKALENSKEEHHDISNNS